MTSAPPTARIADLLVSLGLAGSASIARRVVEQGGVTLGPDRTVVASGLQAVELADGLEVFLGRRRAVWTAPEIQGGGCSRA